MIHLPTRYYVVPIDADFRPDPLPPELASTWRLLRAISWVNDYRFTPPVSMAELARLRWPRTDTVLENLERTLVEHLKKLEAAGWLAVDKTPGRKNVYRPIVPPISQSTAVWAEGPSISQKGKDSPRWSDAATASATISPTGESGFTSPINNNVVVVVVGTSVPSSFEKASETTTINNKDTRRTYRILQQAGIAEPVLSELAAGVPWRTALDWFLWIKYVKPRPVGRAGADIAVPIAIKRLRADPQAVSLSTDAQYDKWFAEFEREATYGPIKGTFGQSIASAVHKSELHQLFYTLYDGCAECGLVELPDPDDGESTDSPEPADEAAAN